MNPSFFEYVYDKDNSTVIYDQLLYMSQGTIMDGLNSTIISNLLIPIPNLQEQEEIVEYLDNKCAVTDAIIRTQEKMIDKLKEYKQSMNI